MSVNVMIPLALRNARRKVPAVPETQRGGRDDEVCGRGFAQGLDDGGGAGRSRDGSPADDDSDEMPQQDRGVLLIAIPL